ncbi:hypothetical protein CRUP_037424, partial [Coryphaenoides rupestris]
MRGEVQQERAARQDLECDKMSLERQVLLPQLTSRIQDLEDRLQGEK